MNGKGGVEYAVRRDTDGAWLYDADLDGADGAWLYDADLDGADGAWEPDMQNATWCASKEDALHVADLNGLTGVDYALADGYSMWERDWVNEEEIGEDWEPAEPRPVA